jgi:hypothetical protein
VLTKTLPEVAALYRDVMGGRLIHQEEVAGTRRSAFIAVGEDTVIEVLQARWPGPGRGPVMLGGRSLVQGLGDDHY